MAKYCGNCGKSLDDAAKVCGYCGTPFGTAASTTIYVDPEKKAKQKKLLVAIVAAVAAVAVLITAITAVSNLVGYKGVVRRTVNAIEDYDIDALINLTSELRLDVYDYYGGEAIENMYESQLTALLDLYEDKTGGDFRLSYEIEDVEELSDRKVDTYVDNLHSMFDDLGSYKIDKILVVELDVTAKDGRDKYESDLELYLIKEDGKWKLLQIGEDLWVG